MYLPFSIPNMVPLWFFMFEVISKISVASFSFINPEVPYVPLREYIKLRSLSYSPVSPYPIRITMMIRRANIPTHIKMPITPYGIVNTAFRQELMLKDGISGEVPSPGVPPAACHSL